MNEDKTRVAGTETPPPSAAAAKDEQTNLSGGSSSDHSQEPEAHGPGQTKSSSKPEPPVSVNSDSGKSSLRSGTGFTLSSAGEGSAQSTPLQIGSVLKERFVLEELLGRGGMGVVYKARDLRRIEALDRDPFIAVKVLSAEFQRNPDSFVALQREAKKAQQLAHPNIVTVYDFDRDGSNVFMTMELLEGEPLDQVIRRLHPGSMPMGEAIKIIEQMSRALAYAHKEKIVHSDFKPGNVFLTSKQVVKVVDFGIARAAQKSDLVPSDATVFDPGSLGALTPAYASCEMLEQGAPDPRDDVYGLAVVAYELLTGQHPFNRKTATYARDIDLKPRRPKEWPRYLWSAITNALQFERERRTPDATVFLQEVSGARKGRAAVSTNWLIYGAAALVLALAGMGALLYFEQAGITPQQEQWVLEDTSKLDQATRQKVENLLEVAEAHQLVGRYIEPPGSNAYAAYQQILDLHRNNRQAILGLQAIGDHLEQLARSLLEQGDVDKSRALAEQGIAAVPEHQGLLKLLRELE